MQIDTQKMLIKISPKKNITETTSIQSARLCQKKWHNWYIRV